MSSLQRNIYILPLVMCPVNTTYRVYDSKQERGCIVMGGGGVVPCWNLSLSAGSLVEVSLDFCQSL
jgi:hypothetical protein